MSQFPLQPPAAARRKYLAYVFGSDDGTPEGIPHKLDRELYDALIRFEWARAVLQLEAACYEVGSPDGTVAAIPNAKTRAELVKNFRNSGQEIDQFHRVENQYPALVRDIDASKFLKPFNTSE